MQSKTDRLTDNGSLLSNYKPFKKSDNDQSTISERLQNLPKIGVSEQFDQKMAAAFAVELQKETTQRNKSWLEKHPQISLPNVISDLTKNLL